MPEYVAANRRGLKDVLRREHPDIVIDLYSGPQGTARVASAARFDGAEGHRFTGANAVWFDAPIIEREPRDDEFAAYEDAVVWEVPDECYAIEIPDPERLREWIRDEDLSAHKRLRAGIEAADRRAAVVRDLQEAIELNRWRANKLDRHGYTEGLYPEWLPGEDYKDRSRDHHRDMVRMRADAYKDSWRTALGLCYRQLFETRRRHVLGRCERRLDAHEIVALDVVAAVRDHAADETYCQHCGAVWTAVLFLDVVLRGYEDRDEQKTRRVCEYCADRWAGTWEFDGETRHGDWTEQAVAQAKDERAQRLGDGGQRRLEGYTSITGCGDDG